MAQRAAFPIPHDSHSPTAARIVIHFLPVPLKTYDESLNYLRSSLDAAKLGDRDKLAGFRRLDSFVRAVETELEPKAEFDAVVAHEKAISPSLDGRSVFDDKPRQLRLF